MNTESYNVDAAIAIADDFGLENYDEAYDRLRRLFASYRHYRIQSIGKRPDDAKLFSNRQILAIEALIEKHKALFVMSGDEDARLRHNAFVLYYIGGLNFEAVGRHLNVTKRTAIKYRDVVLRNMLILLYGVDGLRKSPPKAVITPSVASGN